MGQIYEFILNYARKSIKKCEDNAILRTKHKIWRE